MTSLELQGVWDTWSVKYEHRHVLETQTKRIVESEKYDVTIIFLVMTDSDRVSSKLQYECHLSCAAPREKTINKSDDIYG